MKGNKVTIYARADEFGDVAIFKAKPVIKLEENFFGDKEKVVKTKSAADVFGGDLTALTGVKVPEDRTLKITIFQSKTAKKGNVLFAANLQGSIELFDFEPTLVTEKEERYGSVINYITYERAPSTFKKVTRTSDDDLSLATFCRAGFRKATGLKLVKNAVTRLVVTTKTLVA